MEDFEEHLRDLRVCVSMSCRHHIEKRDLPVRLVTRNACMDPSPGCRVMLRLASALAAPG
jgi:hypothetical protein